MKPKTRIYSFWNRVDKLGPVHPIYGQCWIWVGSLRSDGYGVIVVEGVQVPAHRFSWELHFGQLGKEFVCHHCDNKSCVNPNHLFLGDAKANADDLVSKGLQVRGERHGRSLLTEWDVLSIRDLYTKGCRKFGSVGLAKLYGVAPETILDIVKRKRWRHLN